MNAVLIISATFPYGEAFSSRARYLSLLLNSIGYNVHVIAPIDNKQKETTMNNGRITIQRVRDPKNVFSLSGFGTYKPYMSALLKYSKSNNIDIIISSSMVFVADYIMDYAKKNDIPYIIEQCEWYDSSTFKGGRINPYYMEHIRRIEKKNKDLDGVIAISRLFFEHYSKQGLNCVRIPTILDKQEIVPRIDIVTKDYLKLVFAGSLGKGKEMLKPIFEALFRANSESKRIVLDIYGPTESQVLENIGGDTELLMRVKDYVIIHGRVPQADIENLVRNADFSIFIRPNRRSSNAGFPTKFAESMMVGTPVITNNTGDVSLYLENGSNGYLVGDNVTESLYHIFVQIINSSSEEYINLRKAARITAEKYFDYRSYSNQIASYISQCENNRHRKEINE